MLSLQNHCKRNKRNYLEILQVRFHGALGERESRFGRYSIATSSCQSCRLGDSSTNAANIHSDQIRERQKFSKALFPHFLIYMANYYLAIEEALSYFWMQSSCFQYKNQKNNQDLF